MTNKYNAVIPFDGFYNSIHSEMIDREIEQLAEKETAKNSGEYELNSNILEYLQDNINYSNVHQKYSKMFCDYATSELDFKVKFHNLDSPQFYNYTTDEIKVRLKKKAIKKMVKHVLENRANDFREIMRNSNVEWFPIDFKGFKNLVQPDTNGNYDTWQEWTIINNIFHLYIDDNYPDFDHSFVDYKTGWYDGLRGVIINTLDSKVLDKYNKMCEV